MVYRGLRRSLSSDPLPPMADPHSPSLPSEPDAIIVDSTTIETAPADEAESMGSNRAFTLIEMLVVIAIVGILTAIAFPKFSMAKEKALLARMGSDLRNLMQSQEAYFNEHHTYYAGALPSPDLVYAPSDNVTVTVVAATDAGWSAKSTSGLTAHSCAVFMGDAAPVAPATVEARVVCDK